MIKLNKIGIGPVFLKVRFTLIGLIVGLASISFGNPQKISNITGQTHTGDYFAGHLPDKLVTLADFYKYARIRDEKFSEMLRETWHDYSILPSLSEESQRILFNQPSFDNSSLDNSSPVSLAYSGVVGLPDPGEDYLRMIPRIRKPESDSFNGLRGNFLFYGQKIAIRYDKLLALSTTASVSEDSIAGFWDAFSRSNSYHLVDQLMDYRDLLGLGDWGYFLLVKATSACIFPDSRLSADQMTWALLIRSGFDVRLAFNQSTTAILFPCDNAIYAIQSVRIGQQRFYLDRPMKSRLLVACPNPFPDNRGILDLRFSRSLNFRGKLTIQKYGMSWGKQKYQFALRFNPDEIRFLKEYPRTDPAVYFRAPVSNTLKEDLFRQLYPVLSQFKQEEATAFLLKFVQQEFEYFSPNKKVGELPPLFAEELIASKSGDDRGKATLFSWLTRTLLRLPVVGIQFPGYFSAAVCFDEPLDGDGYLWKHGKYVLADPTFQKAPIGILMPELSGLTPQLIELPGLGSQLSNGSEIWKLAYDLGARRGGASQDFIFNRQGRGYITGYFAAKKSNNPFVACFSAGKTLQWIRRFEGKGKAEAFAITKVNEDEIYIAGSFSGNLEMDGKSLHTSPEKRGLFLAQFTQKGELIWMKPVPIDSLLKDRPLAYVVKFDRSGNEINIQWKNEDLRNARCGFTGVSETGLTLTGSWNFSSSVLFNSRIHRVNNTENVLYQEFKRLKNANGNPKVEGLLAVLKLLQKENCEITGKQIQLFINHENPLFATIYPLMFNMYGRIAVLINEDGIISLKTSDFKSLVFNNLKIENGARFKITQCDNGDALIEVISGVQNMVNPVLLPLNSLLIDSSAGNLIIDYDEDHTLKTMWLDPKP